MEMDYFIIRLYKPIFLLISLYKLLLFKIYKIHTYIKNSKKKKRIRIISCNFKKFYF